MSRYILNEVETSHHLILIRLYFILTILITEDDHNHIVFDWNKIIAVGVKRVIQPIRAKNIYKVVPLKKNFLSLCCIVTNTEWNGIIKLIIEVKCIRIILSPNLIDLIVF